MSGTLLKNRRIEMNAAMMSAEIIVGLEQWLLLTFSFLIYDTLALLSASSGREVHRSACTDESLLALRQNFGCF